MQEFWTKEPSTKDQPSIDKLLAPRAAYEIKQFQDVIASLRGSGHQVYGSLYAGIPHVKTDPCDEGQLRDFEETTLQCLNTGGYDALVDSGVGFWTEHRKLAM